MAIQGSPEIFSIVDVEMVMKGQTPKKCPTTRQLTVSSSTLPRTNALTQSEKQKIQDYYVLNLTNFNKKCDELDNIGTTDISNIVKQIRTLKEDCTKEVLSMGGQTMQDDFEELAKEIEVYIGSISDYVDSLKTRGKTVSTNEQQVYQNTISLMNKAYENNRKNSTVKLTPPNQNFSTVPPLYDPLYTGGRK